MFTTASPTDPTQPIDPRPNMLPLAEARRRFVDDIQRSGPAPNEPWVDKARGLLGDLRGGLKPAIASHVSFSRPRCFRAGCAVEMVADDQEAFHTADDALTQQAESRFLQWDGVRHRSPPERLGDGRVTATLVLWSPATQANNRSGARR